MPTSSFDAEASKEQTLLFEGHIAVKLAVGAAFGSGGGAGGAGVGAAGTRRDPSPDEFTRSRRFGEPGPREPSTLAVAPATSAVATSAGVADGCACRYSAAA